MDVLRSGRSACGSPTAGRSAGPGSSPGRRSVATSGRTRVCHRFHPVGADSQAHAQAPVGERQHEAAQRAECAETRRLDNRAGGLVGIGVHEVRRSGLLQIRHRPPQQRDAGEECPIGRRDHEIAQQRPAHRLVCEREAARKLRHVGVEAARLVPTHPTLGALRDRLRVRAVEERRELGALVCQEQPLDLVSVLEGIDARNRERSRARARPLGCDWRLVSHGSGGCNCRAHLPGASVTDHRARCVEPERQPLYQCYSSTSSPPPYAPQLRNRVGGALVVRDRQVGVVPLTVKPDSRRALSQATRGTT